MERVKSFYKGIPPIILVLLITSILFNFLFFISLVKLNSTKTSFEKTYTIESLQEKQRTQEDSITQITKYPPMREGVVPDFWEYDEFEGHKKRYYVSKTKDIGFVYPDNLAVYESGEWCGSNIYLLPKQRIDNEDTDISKGFAIRIFNCAKEDEVDLVEKHGKLKEKNPFWLSDNHLQIDGLVYENTLKGGYLYDFLLPTEFYNVQYNKTPAPHARVTVVYNTPEELKIAQDIISSMVTDYSYDLEYLSTLSTTANSYFPKSISNTGKRLYVSPNPKVTFMLPENISITEDPISKYCHDVVLVGSHNASRNDPPYENNDFRISNDDECVGFSTSHSLCANVGINGCNYYGSFLLPGLGTHITVVTNTISGKNMYKGVFYTADLSADIHTNSSDVLKEVLRVFISMRE